MPRRVPKDAEIQAAGIALGHGPGPYPSKLRAQLANTVLEAERLETKERVQEAGAGEFADRIADLYHALHPKLSASVAETVVGAIAPQVYREVTTKENTAQ